MLVSDGIKMENEQQDQTSEETPSKETSEETAPVEETITIPKAKWQASQEEGIRLAKELESREKAKEAEIPEEEKKLREVISRYEKERESSAMKLLREEARKLDELEQIHGSFKRDEFKKFLDDYPTFDIEGNIDYHKAYQLYERVQSAPAIPKKKTPSSARTGDVPRKETYNVQDKNMWDILNDAKKEIQD
jgi:hypothetical protein